MNFAKKNSGLLFILLFLVACAHQRPHPDAPIGKSPPPSPTQPGRYAQAHDGGPASPALDISKIPEPTPKREPLSHYGNKSPYTVLGRTYSVLPSSKGYVERGIASWYGTKFQGYKTSSYELYDMYSFTAANKTLPLPSYARVTNLENGKSVIVRINDRGPFHENRIVDLSYAAAVKIGVWPKGTGMVEVRAIDPEHIHAAPLRSIENTAQSGQPHIYLQLGAYAEKANAEYAVKTAEQGGIGDVRIETANVSGQRVHRVRVGPLASVEAADALMPRLEHLGLGVARVAIDD